MQPHFDSRMSPKEAAVEVVLCALANDAEILLTNWRPLVVILAVLLVYRSAF